jgi:3,5-epimerase/4-reductase
MKILIIGKGFIGQRCAQKWSEAIVLEDKILSASDASAALEKHEPDVVLNAGGTTGRPNVDWCEEHPKETMLGNVALPINLAIACQEKQVYLLHLGSGCIFYGESPDPQGWKEDDFANPIAVYSKAKYAADLALMNLPHTGIARIRMPIDNVPHSKNLIDKLANYPKVIDVENSVTIVPDLIAVLHQLLEKKASGVFHATNPGTTKHKKTTKPHKNEWISAEDLVAQGLAKKLRSNNFLQSANLKKVGISMPPVKESLRRAMEQYAKYKT